MAAGVSFSRKRKINGFMSVLSSAACEWFLMFLLFLDAAFWYLLLKFVRYCELETPCLLCSRLDHGLGKKKHSLCWSLLCSAHRDEISSLVSCSVHCRFADVHSLCEECHSSIVKQKKSSSLENMACSCCNITVKAKSNTGRLLQLDPLGFGASRATNIGQPLPSTPVSTQFSHSDSLKRFREKIAGTVVTDEPAQEKSVGVDIKSTVAYTKLDLSSDSESEFAHSEDDDDDDDVNNDSVANTSVILEHDTEQRLDELPSDSDALESQGGQGFNVKSLALDPPSMIKTSDHKNDDTFSSDANTKHFALLDQEEECYYKRGSSLTRKLISLCDSFSPRGGAVGSSAETSGSSVSLPHRRAISVPSEVISVCNVAPLSNDTRPEKEYAGETSENGEPSEASNVKATVGTYSDGTRLSTENDKHQMDASVHGDGTLQLSSRSAFEPTDTRGSAKIEDLAAVSTSELGSFQEEGSHGAHHKRDEFKIGDPHSKILPYPASSENNDSYVSADEIAVNDIEGESILEQLRRQIEHDHNCLNSLYKELDEERNAAAIAAEEAMAMITRLQEEKAALRMEASHYLRMMEEQAAYDSQALDKANDLLSERERELQDLEYELDAYRNNYLDEPDEDDIQETSPGASSDSKADKILRPNGNCKPTSGSASSFEDENMYSGNVMPHGPC
ncbi:probable myosin-binding protein 4 isoform X2 [Salvia splendens]|uniref:probable myosin-binding protein 4 isoform X2 n=1 Tax=Salvia splendens TaxID=180675 RepID=UPI001C252E86|nr:probable myosin-binding protein 4 isoform X2 [Salvia splendens]